MTQQEQYRWIERLFFALVVSAFFMLFTSPAQGEQPKEVAIDRGDGLPLSVEVPPDCTSKLFRWNGETLECLETDRISILEQQRNTNKQAWRAEQAKAEACRQQILFLQADRAMEVRYARAREDCRKQGKAFNKETVLCEGALSKEEE